MWHETNSQNDGILKRETKFPMTEKELVLSGPHFFIGEPLYKTPRTICTEKGHYDVIDLVSIGDNYLPRTNYIPACDMKEYENKTPIVSWLEPGENNAKKINEYYRIAFRGMLSIAGERTLTNALIMKSVAHTNAVRTYAFSKNKTRELLVFLSESISIPFDFLIKTIGKANLHQLLDDFPLIESKKYDKF